MAEDEPALAGSSIDRLRPALPAFIDRERSDLRDADGFGRSRRRMLPETRTGWGEAEMIRCCEGRDLKDVLEGMDHQPVDRVQAEPRGRDGGRDGSEQTRMSLPVMPQWEKHHFESHGAEPAG